MLLDIYHLQLLEKLAFVNPRTTHAQGSSKMNTKSVKHSLPMTLPPFVIP